MNVKGIVTIKLLIIAIAISILIVDCQKGNGDGTTANLLNPVIIPESIADSDSNTYKAVTIGTQVWMAENLKTTKYNDGTDIPLITEISELANPQTPAYYWYNNDSAI
jgi:hypothetical protein